MIENLFTGTLRIKSTNQHLTLKMKAFKILILSLRTLQTIADPTLGHFCVSIFIFVDIFGKYFGCCLRIEVCLQSQTVDIFNVKLQNQPDICKYCGHYKHFRRNDNLKIKKVIQ